MLLAGREQVKATSPRLDTCYYQVKGYSRLQGLTEQYAESDLGQTLRDKTHLVI